MLISDFLASQAPHPEGLAWAGSPLPDHAAFTGMRVADAGERVVVQVSAIRTAELPAALTILDDLAEKDRAVLLTDALLAEPVSRELAVELAERGLELLHAVYIDDAATIQVLAGLSLQRTGARGDLAAANLAAVTVGDGEPDWEQARRAFARVTERHETYADTIGAAEAELAAAEARLDAVTVQWDRAAARLETLRSSTTPQVGQAAVTLARHPFTSARRSVGKLRRAWRLDSRSRATHGGPRRLRLEVPIPFPPGEGRHRPDALRVDVPATSMVARSLFRNGVSGYEPTMMAWYLALCDTVQPGAVWDVGANLGLYALLARAYTDREVVAFEPTPELAGWARQLSADNDLDYRLEQVAAGESPGVATFYLSETSDASNSLAEGFRTSKRQLDVLVEPLDRYSRRTGSVPAVLKIDTETTEHHVLRGAREVVARNRPWIFCEVLANRAPEKELTALMSGFGYHFFHLNGADPLVETGVIVGDPTFQHMNYLFTPTQIEPRMIDAARAWHAALEVTPKATHR
ncbi:FkbM family methyltransferase [Jiangella aurantiaca]|uniref:FkbM family methyltransferase n=1 Tax=Jiangella aurantiaca TaxID=2530373 RepID=A0A4R5ARF9_9ACTN|nr:FkbM family methyltransferase [Jiangella aurantiaca]TDD72972.1 FkbM family methyltransferase [Jiangella aurantiaca]